MDNKIQNIINSGNNTMLVNNNIDLNLSISFNNLSYTLIHENINKYINNNSLVLNVEDTNTIYNIFEKYNNRFSYQLNNIVFINNENDFYVLNDNLSSIKNFSIDNNLIKFNIFENSSYLPNFNEQSIYAYNSKNLSYVYSNEDKLSTLSFYKKGLFSIDNDTIVLNENKLGINVDKFKYNQRHIYSFVNNSNYILRNYNNSVEQFSETNKYKNCKYTKELTIYTPNNTNYKFNDNSFSIVTNGSHIKTHYVKDSNNRYCNDIVIKDTEYLVIDIPFEYEYETMMDKDYNYHKILCPIKLENIKYKITAKQNTISNKIALNRMKSFIHKNKPIKIYCNVNSYLQQTKVLEKCNVSLYFNIDNSLYEYIYKLNKKNKSYNFVLDIFYNDEICYSFNCSIDIMKNQFKKLYHNYNYGFNFDKHGDAIGIMMLQRNNDVSIANDNVVNISINNNNYDLMNDNTFSNFIQYKETNKDIFVNYDPTNIYNTFIDIKELNYDFNKIDGNFNALYVYQSNSSTTFQVSTVYIDNNRNNILSNLVYPNNLNIKDFLTLYKHYNDNLDQITINNYKLENIITKNILFNGIYFSKNFGLIKQYNYKANNARYLNNNYIMDKDKHSKLFDTIHKYRKSGLLFGDFYTPCIQDYLNMKFFGMQNYFNLELFSDLKTNFINDSLDENQKIYHFISNQFLIDVSDSNILKNATIKFNSEFNEYSLDFLNHKDKTDNDIYNYINFIWPLFRIPDFSIINSNNYIIMFDEKENCEYIDYYLNDGNYLYISFRSYYDHEFDFKVFDENLNETNNIQITDVTLLDETNNIYCLNIYSVDDNIKQKIFYICFIDSENYMNNLKINNDKYRILCKVYLKNENI